jgi:hypothetical protein
MAAAYEIMVGKERGSMAYAGFPEKVINRNVDDGVTFGVHRATDLKEAMIRVGTYGIPNYTAAWGRRVANGKPKIVEGVEMGYEVGDAQYKGEIEFLKWGDVKGQSIDCRWIRNVLSLDQTYQDLILKVKIREQDPWAVILEFKQGYNKFDEVADKALIQFLRVHYYNEHSIAKSPNAESKLGYKEVRKQEIRQQKTKSIDNKVDNILLVGKLSEGQEATQKLKNLLAVVNGVEFTEVNKDSIDDVYAALKTFADENPDMFSSRIHEYKKANSAAITKAETYEKLDLTKDGTIGYLDKGKSKPFIEGIPAKGNDMKQWAFENWYMPNVFEGLDKLKKFTDKL